MKDNTKLSEQIKIMEFPDFGDERGNLVVVEGGMDIPFEVKRAFYIYGSDSEVIRGRHANRKRLLRHRKGAISVRRSAK